MLIQTAYFQHVVFGVCRLIDLIVPDIPESLDVKIKRERYLAKEALQDADHVLQVTKMEFTLFVLAKLTFSENLRCLNLPLLVGAVSQKRLLS